MRSEVEQDSSMKRKSGCAGLRCAPPLGCGAACGASASRGSAYLAPRSAPTDWRQAVRFKTLFLTLALACTAGASFGMKLDDTFHFMTTLVVTSTPVGQTQGTGFYYHHLAPGDSSKTGP